MTDKTIAEIKAEFGHQGAEAATSYQDTLAEIIAENHARRGTTPRQAPTRGANNPPAGAKAERAAEERRGALEAYTDALERCETELGRAPDTFGAVSLRLRMPWPLVGRLSPASKNSAGCWSWPPTHRTETSPALISWQPRIGVRGPDGSVL